MFKGDERVAKVLEGNVLYISFVTELELLGYPGLDPIEERLIKRFLKDCIIVDLNPVIKEKTIKFRRKYNLTLPDSIIAATAYYLGVPLFSADKDFIPISEIDFLEYERS